MGKMDKKPNILYFIGVVYFTAYVASFKPIIDFGIFAWQFLLEICIMSLILLVYLKLPKLRLYGELTRGFKVTLWLVIISVIGFHLFSGYMGSKLGPSFIRISDHPSVSPMEITNIHLVNINKFGLVLTLIVALFIGYLIDKSFIKNKNILTKYLIIIPQVISFLVLNYVFLFVINILSLFYGLSTGG